MISNDKFGIGDTLTQDNNIIYQGIPQFAPEHFIFLNNPNPSNYKRYRDGLDQLLSEGVVQGFDLNTHSQNNYVIGAVGPLQFDVVQYRLKSEYKAETERYLLNRRVSCPKVDKSILPVGAIAGQDRYGQLVILFSNQWSLGLFQDKHAEIELSDTPFRRELMNLANN